MALPTYTVLDITCLILPPDQNAQVSVYTSDGQTTARGPDAAHLEVLSGPRQILK